MKRLIVSLVLALILALSPATVALAADSAGVTVTATPGVISIIVYPTSIGFGVVAENTTYYSLGANTTAPDWPLADNECYFEIGNDSTVLTDIYIKGTDFTGGDEGWTLSDNGTNGATGNTTGMKAGITPAANPAAFVVVAKSGANGLELKADLAASTNQTWELLFLTPLTFTNTDVKENTITITAIGG